MSRALALFRRLDSLIQSYGFWGMLRLVADGIATRARVPGAHLLRRPFYLRGQRWMVLGRGLVSGPGLRLDAFPTNPSGGPVLRIGRDVQVNDDVHVAAVSSVTIGDRVLIASRVFITDHNHGTYKGPGPHTSPLLPPAQRVLSYASVCIGDDAWIGEQVSILPGVTIGEGAVIGTLSVVNRDVEPYTIAVGSPARAVRRFNFETQLWEPV